jgi:hypothetical protein
VTLGKARLYPGRHGRQNAVGGAKELYHLNSTRR